MFLEDSKARWDEINSWVPEQILPRGKGPLREQIEKSGTQIVDRLLQNRIGPKIFQV